MYCREKEKSVLDLEKRGVINKENIDSKFCLAERLTEAFDLTRFAIPSKTALSFFLQYI